MGVVWTFLLSSILSPLSPSLWETARYRLQYCLKGPLNPKQPTNQRLVSQGSWVRYPVWQHTSVSPSAFSRRAVVGWLVGCFGFNGPLRQYFSLYQAVSQREGEREEKGQMRAKMSKQPPPAPTASAVGPCPTVIKIVGRPGTGSLPSTFAPPDHPQGQLSVTGESMCTKYWLTA